MKASPAKCWLLIGSTPALRFFRPAPTFFPLFHTSTPKRLASNQKRAFRCRYKHPFSPTILRESLTSSDKLIADSSLKQTPHSENSQTYIPNRQSAHSSAAAAVTDSSAECISCNEIDELCTSLRTNLASASLYCRKYKTKIALGLSI